MLITRTAYTSGTAANGVILRAALASNSRALEESILELTDPNFLDLAHAQNELAHEKKLARRLAVAAKPRAQMLATIWATKEAPQAKSAALSIFRESLNNGVELTRHQEMLFLSTCLELGLVVETRRALELCSRISPDFRLTVETDLKNPVIAGPKARMRAWNKLFSRAFKIEGLDAPQVDLHAAVPFDTLNLKARKSVDGPLVSVIMSTYRRGTEIEASVRSVLNQSYQNLELIIVDDASGSEHSKTLENIADLDLRIKIHRLPVNGGTYVARNFGISQAHGEFITTQDDDDWLHPLRLEEQVSAITNTPGAVASRSEAMRAKPDMTFFWPGYERRRLGASSLLFRRSVIDAIGYFDEVRKGADSEFTERIQKFIHPIVDVAKPLSLTRLDTHSLSRSDFRYGWRHPDRDLYVTSYRGWHEQLKAKEASNLAFPVEPVGRLPFYAPESFLKRDDAKSPVPEARLMIFINLADESQVAALTSNYSAMQPKETILVVVRDPLATASAKPQTAQRALTELHQRGMRIQSDASAARANNAIILAPDVLIYTDIAMIRDVAQNIFVASWPPRDATSLTDHVGIADVLREEFSKKPHWFAPTAEAQEQWEESGWVIPTFEEVLRSAQD